MASLLEVGRRQNKQRRLRQEIEDEVSRLLRALLEPVPVPREEIEGGWLGLIEDHQYTSRNPRLPGLCEQVRHARSVRLALAWMVLTGQPPVFVIRARWEEVDLAPNPALWTPAPVGHGVMDAGPVVLSGAARRVLKQAREVGDGLGLVLDAVRQVSPRQTCDFDDGFLRDLLEMPEPRPDPRIFPDVKKEELRYVLKTVLKTADAQASSLTHWSTAFGRWRATNPDCKRMAPLDAWGWFLTRP